MYIRRKALHNCSYSATLHKFYKQDSSKDEINLYGYKTLLHMFQNPGRISEKRIYMLEILQNI